jgi:hypothetical protein
LPLSARASFLLSLLRIKEEGKKTHTSQSDLPLSLPIVIELSLVEDRKQLVPFFSLAKSQERAS